MKSILPKFAAAVILCFSIGAEAADKKTNSTHEAKRAIAIKQIDDFGQRMAMLDPNYSSKSTRITAAASIITKNYSPDQWLERVQFLYAVLSEIDAKAVSIDPEAILAKYYPDEAQRAPLNVMSYNSDVRNKWIDQRGRELQEQLDANTVDDLEHAARMLAVAKVYFPYDKRFVNHRQYKLDLAVRLTSGEIDRQRYDSLWAMKRQEFNGEVAREKSQIQQQQQMANDQAAAQQSAIDAQRRSVMLSNAARSVQNATNSQRVPVTCTAVANIMTCR